MRSWGTNLALEIDDVGEALNLYHNFLQIYVPVCFGKLLTKKFTKTCFNNSLKSFSPKNSPKFAIKNSLKTYSPNQKIHQNLL